MFKPEILSPAGSYEAFIAAVHSGCNAVYLGGENYGARAYAKNFDLETLDKAIKYARMYGVKIYYTVNTLFKEKELDQLLEHLLEVYHLGVDAFILQDIGVISLLKRVFPDIEVHGSTQLNCHSVEGVRFLEDMGVKRVVLARELSIDEIIYIKRETKMEIETFVHGALCYSYSGQCLMSSFMGGRSGNRGRCAQPCRLAYKAIIDEKEWDKSHILSPKDIETLTVLPELIDAGIESFKIEGRMKSKEYVGLMTGLYRYYRDAYLENGTLNIKQNDLDDMVQIFNRGNFTNGYYFQHNGPTMITFDQPKHQGRIIGKVKSKNGNQYALTLFEKIRIGDCLEIAYDQGDYYSWIAQLNTKSDYIIYSDYPIQIGQEVRRIKSIELENRLLENQSNIHHLGIDIEVVMQVDRPIEMIIKDDNREVRVIGDLVQAAKNQSLLPERVEKQFSKVDQYPIKINHIKVNIIGDVFMSMGQLNGIRREGFEKWLGLNTKVKKKPYVPVSVLKVENTPSYHKNITVLLRKFYQFEILKDYSVQRIYIEHLNFSEEQILEIINFYKNQPTQIYIAVPKILRHEKNTMISILKESLADEIDGFLLRSIDAYHHALPFGKKMVFDYPLSIMNQHSANYLMFRELSEGYVPSLELNKHEMKQLPLNKAEYIVYGHMNVMTSAQCIRKSLNDCKKENGKIIYLEDRKGMKVPVETVCKLCYNQIYNGVPHYLIDKINEMKEMGIKNFRVEFLNESKEDMVKVLNAVTSKTTIPAQEMSMVFTRGHYTKGVE